MNTTIKSMLQKATRLKGKTLAMLSVHSPEILTGFGIAGLIGTVALTARAAVKIDRILTEAEEAKGEKLTAKEIAENTWKEAIPVVISTAATAACIFASHQASANRRTALMAAYALADDKLKAYEKAAKDILDNNKADELHEKAMGELFPEDEAHIFECGGQTLCLDVVSGRMFRSSMELIRRAQNDLNEMVISDWNATLNDFYDCLGLSRIKESVGGSLGWNSNKLLRIRFESVLSEGGDPVLVMDYDVYPEYQLI